ncbi:hypothetical protein [Actinokineospora xionganensis]|uniref:ML domain-containing protein n=1 Tax=Actinokineospora xionganensis TaxID=2684470 RepID=A0ABR7L8I9_9PSEU|nr:hypothetical protein [Actinokineospora xionganensis]MBC6449020.1 hypothetical protein [Actinokineospora xionganensis]
MKLTTIGRRTRVAVAAAVILLTATFTATGAAADPIGSCATITKFTMTFRTGGDDLRYNSELLVSIKVPHLTQPLPLRSVFGQFPNNSTVVKVDIPFATTGQTVNSCHIRAQHLTLISHSAWFEGPDNWDMNSFSIVGYTSSGVAKYQHSSGTGSPWFRFSQSKPTLVVHDWL